MTPPVARITIAEVAASDAYDADDGDDAGTMPVSMVAATRPPSDEIRARLFDGVFSNNCSRHASSRSLHGCPLYPPSFQLILIP